MADEKKKDQSTESKKPTPLTGKPLEEDNQSEVQEFFEGLGAWWKKHGTFTLIIVLVCIGTSMLYNWWSTRDERNREAAYEERSGAATGDALLAVAGNHTSVHAFAANTRLQAGNAFYNQTKGNPLDPSAKRPDDATRDALLKKAAESYDFVLNDPSATTSQKIQAHRGLAVVSEDIGDKKKAVEHYNEIIRIADGFPNLKLRATNRRDNIDNIEVVHEMPDKPYVDPNAKKIELNGSDDIFNLPKDRDPQKPEPDKTSGSKKPDANKPKSPDTAKPKIPDNTKPKKPDTTKPKTPDTTKPKSPENAKKPVPGKDDSKSSP